MALQFDNITFDTFFDDTGDPPEAWVLYSVSDASVSSPTWVDASPKLRGEISQAGFGSSRGRESELAQVDTGNCTITLDNRSRDFDPVINTGIRPLNRWWVRVQYAGETQDVFKGWAERYDQTWAGTFNAVAVVTCADEFKLLGLDALPTTSPPRASYQEVVESDKPIGYWPLNEPPEFRQQSAQVPQDEPTPTPALPQNPNNGLPFGDDWGWGIRVG